MSPGRQSRSSRKAFITGEIALANPPCRQPAPAGRGCPREVGAEKESDRENQTGRYEEGIMGSPEERGWRFLRNSVERFQERLEGCEKENESSEGER